MAVRKPAADARTLSTPTGPAFRSLAHTVSLWVNLAAIPANGQIYRCLKAYVGGLIIKISPAGDLQFFYAKAAAPGFELLTHAGVPFAPGTWNHLLFSIAGKNYRMLCNDSVLFSWWNGPLLVDVGDPDTPSVLNKFDGTQPTRGAFFDLRHLGRQIGVAEESQLYHGRGAGGPVPDIAWLRGVGATGAVAAPRDLADLSRVWGQSGVGGDYVHEAAPGPCSPWSPP